jgi:hypothetical protein
MLDWLRSFFSTDHRDRLSHREMDGVSLQATNEQEEGAMALDQLYVQPDLGEDFDKEACEQLIAAMAAAGWKTDNDHKTVAVSLENFFVGNNCKHSIAANVEPAPPYDTAESWFSLLKEIRSIEGVHDVVVEIYMIEPYEDGRVGMWPYSDTVWIYSSLDRGLIQSLVAAIEPDEVRDASVHDPSWNLHPPFPAPDGIRPYWIWWD